MQGLAEEQQRQLLLDTSGASSRQGYLQLYGQHSLPALPSFSWGPVAAKGTADQALQQQQQQLVRLQGKAEETPRADGITPKSVFSWQPQSGTASPTTPHQQQLRQLAADAGMHHHSVLLQPFPGCSATRAMLGVHAHGFTGSTLY